ncbi:ATP-dependent RNA helicase DHX37/DHR1 [Nematocida sp. AWRm80]|nr:ATP-dependent RNA helicase DHX37/DHR1 [Nematocida sp. AWRm80]
MASKSKKLQKYLDKKSKQKEKDELLSRLKVLQAESKTTSVSFSKMTRALSKARSQNKQSKRTKSTPQTKTEPETAIEPSTIEPETVIEDTNTNKIDKVDEIDENNDDNDGIVFRAPIRCKDAIINTVSVEPKYICTKHIKTNKIHSRYRTEQNTLPIAYMEDEIITSIKENYITVIIGSTGSGKSTQVPQFLFENGFAESKRICMTQPRRVSAREISKRITEEQKSTPGTICGYRIKHESNTTDTTSIHIVTEGVLLQELADDPLLSKYSVVVIDEIHERSLAQETLLLVLFKIAVKTGLRVVLMSATITEEYQRRVEEVSGTKVSQIKIGSLHYPVHIHYLQNKEYDYNEEILKRVMKILINRDNNTKQVNTNTNYTTIEPTQDNTLDTIVNNLINSTLTEPIIPIEKENTTNTTDTDDSDSNSTIDSNDDSDIDDKKSSLLEIEQSKEIEKEGIQKNSIATEKRKGKEQKKSIKDDSTPITLTGTILIFVPTKRNTEQVKEYLQKIIATNRLPVPKIYTLHSDTPSEDQNTIINSRDSIIIATNIAETSLTIPDVSCIIDSGREIQKKYDYSLGMHRYSQEYISRFSAEQRKGRAGRVQPGVCYRLYTTMEYDKFTEERLPEIQTQQLTPLVTTLLKIGVQPQNITRVSYVTPPNPSNIQIELEGLIKLNILNSSGTSLTQLGIQALSLSVPPLLGTIVVTELSKATDKIDKIVKEQKNTNRYITYNEVHKYNSIDNKNIPLLYLISLIDLLGEKKEYLNTNMYPNHPITNPITLSNLPYISILNRSISNDNTHRLTSNINSILNKLSTTLINPLDRTVNRVYKYFTNTIIYYNGKYYHNGQEILLANNIQIQIHNKYIRIHYYSAVILSNSPIKIYLNTYFIVE